VKAADSSRAGAGSGFELSPSLGEAVARVPSDKPWMFYMGVLDGRPDDSCTVDQIVYGRESP